MVQQLADEDAERAGSTHRSGHAVDNVGASGSNVASANEVQLSEPLVVPGWNDADLDDAFLYGANFLGHEITHAFDADGRHYDADGNKVDWWTGSEDAAFKERSSGLLVDQ